MTVVPNLREQALRNNFYLQVIETEEWGQITLMCLFQGEEISPEVHKETVQVTTIVSGNGVLRLKNIKKYFEKDDVIIISPGQYHHFLNTSSKPLKLYTYYTRAEHDPYEFLHTDPGNINNS